MTDIDEQRTKPISHQIIGRAGGPQPDSASIQARISYRGEPDRDYLAQIETELRANFERFFDEPPARVAVVVLPYFTDLDDPDDGERANLFDDDIEGAPV